MNEALQAQRVHKVHVDLLVKLVRMVFQESMAPLDAMDVKESWEIVAIQDLQVFPACRVDLEPLVPLVQLENQGREGRQVPVDRWVPLVELGVADYQALKVPVVTKERMEFKVNVVRKVIVDLLVYKVFLVLLVLLVNRVVQEFPGQLVPEDLLVQLDLMEKKVILDSLDPLGHLDRVGLLERLVLGVLRVKKVFVVLPGLLDLRRLPMMTGWAPTASWMTPCICSMPMRRLPPSQWIRGWTPL